MLTTQQMVGQLFMFGSDMHDQSGFVEQLGELQAGGAILFARDIRTAEQLRSLNDAITEAVKGSCGIRPFIAVDQEGGRVARLRGELCPEFPPSSERGLAYEAGQGAAALVEQARQTARAMLDLHINMNLAPVCDVLRAADSEVLASRCYSSRPRTVSELASAYVARLQADGVIATAKHFPGHGGTVVDSHLSLPVIDISFEELNDIHLPPFRRLVRQEVGAVMTAHIHYSQLDSQPATMSSRIVRELLLGEMHHTGMVITDDLMMGAVMSACSLPDACLAALRAGVSLLLICSDPLQQRAAFERVLDAAVSGELELPLIESAVQRNLALKQRFSII